MSVLYPLTDSKYILAGETNLQPTLINFAAKGNERFSRLIGARELRGDDELPPLFNPHTKLAAYVQVCGQGAHALDFYNEAFIIEPCKSRTAAPLDIHLNTPVHMAKHQNSTWRLNADSTA